MNQNELTQAYINWAVTAVWFVCVIVCFLKGKKWIAIAGIIASISDEIPIGGLVLHRIITTPLILYVYVAAIRLGRPDSFWSRRFYQKNPIKLLRAVERFGPQIEAEVQRAVEEIKAKRSKERASAGNEWKTIADRLNAAGWTWGCTERVDSNGETTFVADAQRSDGKRFVVRADDELTAFLELERQIRTECGPASPVIGSAPPSSSLEMPAIGSKHQRIGHSGARG